ncbi:uncharacterized protein C8Q71DRAFT_723908 [Rhodofomes roseus]|uniref:Zn(2)-C6 fungal-type domain-containing protein n=1 Tax=Rhodofomes roseus TaxID=34475 RepID=A0ABQ8KHE3_9APHY|nr:uncharacterized protein C8Q71DRAFT_723908 [Rhodofomes roseus]KAH9836852.1 hypothetical protein C8Q71DRAFT_723908 [Rhodofomes roseus]
MVGPLDYDRFVDYMRSVGKRHNKRVSRVLFNDPPPDYWTGARLYRLQETVRYVIFGPWNWRAIERILIIHIFTDDWLESLNWDLHDPLPPILHDVWDYQWHDHPDDQLGWPGSLKIYMARHGHPIDQWEIPLRDEDPIAIDAAARSFVNQWLADSRLFTEDQNTTGSLTPSRSMSPSQSKSTAAKRSETDEKKLTKLGIEEAKVLPRNGVDPELNPEYLSDGILFKAELRCAKCLKSRGKTTIACYVKDGLTACAECNRKRVGCSFVQDKPSKAKRIQARSASPEVGMAEDNDFEEWDGIEDEVDPDGRSSLDADVDMKSGSDDSESPEVLDSDSESEKDEIDDEDQGSEDEDDNEDEEEEVEDDEPSRKGPRFSPEIELPSALAHSSPLVGLTGLSSNLGPPSTEVSSFPSPLSSAPRPIEAGPGPSSALGHMQRVIDSQGRTLTDQAGLIAALQLELEQQRSAYASLQAHATSLESQNRLLQGQLASGSSTGKKASGKGKDRAL